MRLILDDGTTVEITWLEYMRLLHERVTSDMDMSEVVTSDDFNLMFAEQIATRDEAEGRIL